MKIELSLLNLDVTFLDVQKKTTKIGFKDSHQKYFILLFNNKTLKLDKTIQSNVNFLQHLVSNTVNFKNDFEILQNEIKRQA